MLPRHHTLCGHWHVSSQITDLNEGNSCGYFVAWCYAVQMHCLQLCCFVWGRKAILLKHGAAKTCKAWITARLTANSRCTSTPPSMLSSLLCNTQAGTEGRSLLVKVSSRQACCANMSTVDHSTVDHRLVSGHWRGIWWCSRVVATNWEQYTGHACWAFAPNSR